VTAEGHRGSPHRRGTSGPSARAEAGEPKATRRAITTEEYVDGVRSGDRVILSRAITLIESNAAPHFAQAREVLQTLLPHTGGSIRVGVTGVPGAGKSAFIDVLGRRLLERGHRVAVTAVDPTSSLSGGSILGDKTRMEKLAADERAFIRPSPSGGILGGVARKTRETILLFEAAGYDVIVVETVGVGQNETAVRSMVDFFLLMLLPGGGDELQGLKRGIFELADAVLVHKADGERRAQAETSRTEYEGALHYLAPATEGHAARAYTASSLTGEGIDEIWGVIERFHAAARASGVLVRRRREQEREWMHQIVTDRLREEFLARPEAQRLLPELERAVLEGRLTATDAAVRLLGDSGA
jgi:LAO/AO transport system kinase